MPTVMAAGYGAGVLSQRWAVAAGEPLPPPDPSDDRLTRPMPRRPDHER